MKPRLVANRNDRPRRPRRAWHRVHRRLHLSPRRRARRLAIALLAAAALLGTGIGLVLARAPSLADRTPALLHDAAVGIGLLRAREAQPFDYWASCAKARAAGAAPIGRDEPGYRYALDADGDGIACETHHRHYFRRFFR